ncbi:MAG: adenylate/guanylate cyclase domain-containing protein, partial [Planctomycetota bacterium]|nr:adenylate/guanylate cyclase domain-containing protein [Planctomycetota bacterium]
MSITLNNLIRYLPDLMLNGLVKRGPEIPQSEDTHFEAAVLFADISGFTALTESLADKGADGVEELTRILNAYFGQIISVVRSHGGDVIKFAGDALLAFWPSDEQASLGIMARRATQCALALQRSLQDFSAPGGVKMSLKVSVSAGDVRSLQLGGLLNRWEFVVAGKPLSDAGKANDQARKGDVVASPSAWALCKDSMEASLLEDGSATIQSVNDFLDSAEAHSPQIDDSLQDQIEGYIPGAVRHRLRAGQTDWLGEFRRLTILFVNLPEMNMEVPLAQAQQAMETLQSALYHFEGSVNKLSVDDKGVSLVAAFGMPPLSHTDDPARGIGAALQIHKQLSSMGWRHSIGVTSGESFCGSIGNEQRCEYTVIGDIVNLSARLMQAAKGRVLCDNPTYLEAQKRYHFEDLGEIKVKGKTTTISIFEPKSTIRTSTRTLGSDHDAVIGRFSERKILAKLFESDRSQDAPLIMIEAPTGLGKSCLMAEIVHKAPQHSIETLAATGDSIDKNTPYRAWHRLFQRILSPRGSESERIFDWTEHLEQVLSDEQKILAPLLNVVLPIDIPDNEFTEELSGEARATKTNELLCQLLETSLEQPTVLLIDDCQWLDSASLSLLLTVFQEQGSLPIALFLRPFEEERPPELVSIQNSDRFEKLSLSPLDQETTTEIIRTRLEILDVPQQAGEIIFEKSQGNPLFSIELAYSLRDGGALVIDNKTCHVSPDLTDLTQFALPNTVQGVVTSRIDKLSAGEQLFLKVASTIGRGFDIQLLQDIYPMQKDRHQCRSLLKGLIEKDLLSPNEFDKSDDAYIFKHIITQNVVYKLMLGGQRRSLHSAIAKWHEIQHNDEKQGMHPVLAKHWRLAGDAAKAIKHLDLAGEYAVRGYANKEAVAFLQEALDQSLEAPVEATRKARWLCHLAEATYRLGDLKTSLDYFSQGLAILGHPFPQSLPGMLLATTAEFCKQTLYRTFPKFFLGRCRPEDRAVLLQAAGCYERLAQIRYLNNAKVETLHSAFKSLNLSEKAGMSPELARSYSNAAVCNGLLLLHGVAQAHTGRALAAAKEVDDRPCSAYVEFINGVYWITVAQWDDCCAALRRSIALAKEIGDLRRYDEAAFTLVNALARQGLFEESAALSQEIYKLAAKRDVPQAMVWGLSGELWALLPAGDTHSERLEVLEKKLEAVLERSERVPLADQILGHGFLSLSYCRHKRYEKSRRSADKAYELIMSTGQVSHFILEAHAALMSTTLYLWHKEGKSSKLAKRANRLLWSFTEFSLMYPFAKARKQLYIGYVHQVKGNNWRARRAWEKGIEVCRAFRMPYEEGLIHQAMGFYQNGEVGKAKARELFERLG